MKYQTINRSAAELGLPHTVLRKMLVQSDLPGFYSGNRYYVDMDLLREKLEEKSKESITKENK